MDLGLQRETPFKQLSGILSKAFFGLFLGLTFSVFRDSAFRMICQKDLLIRRFLRGRVIRMKLITIMSQVTHPLEAVKLGRASITGK
jgi:hypothetical protein